MAQKKGLANTNQLITKSHDEFFDELNVSDDVKTRLKELIAANYIILADMEIFAFDKFQMLNKTNSLATLDAFEAIAKTGKVVKTTQFFANIVTSYQQRQDIGENAKNAQEEPFFAPKADDILKVFPSPTFFLLSNLFTADGEHARLYTWSFQWATQTV